MKITGKILVVDDNEYISEPLVVLLELLGHTVDLARNGLQALEKVEAHEFDLILLDIMMPEMDGYEVLKRLKADPQQHHIPVIMLSAIEDIKSVAHCIEMGAEDYLFKPFDKVLLKARIKSSLERKQWHDREKKYLKQIEQEQAENERLLLNILPQYVIDQLKETGEILPNRFDDVTVLFADIVNFTQLATKMAPTELVFLLNEIFILFDQLVEEYGLEKIKTIGDTYMVVGGVPTPNGNHAAAIADLALALRDEMDRFSQARGLPLALRIGINSGPVVAGVIGKRRFAYDLWGDTVNTASRMESQGVNGQIQVSQCTYKLLQEDYELDARGSISIKGKGEMVAYLLKGKKSKI